MVKKYTLNLIKKDKSLSMQIYNNYIGILSQKVNSQKRTTTLQRTKVPSMSIVQSTYKLFADSDSNVCMCSYV